MYSKPTGTHQRVGAFSLAAALGRLRFRIVFTRAPYLVPARGREGAPPTARPAAWKTLRKKSPACSFSCHFFLITDLPPTASPFLFS